ncbi:MAG: hypothetical protein U5J83_07000 [Bryobacterales bacterium]|nr:hypothetical protein [Bryobacterales bacterium]
MIRSLWTAGALGIAVVATLAAAPFWVEKPYTEWNQKEVAKLLSDSPWVRPASVDLDPSTMRAPGGMGGPDGGMRGPGGGMGGPGGPMGGGMPEFNGTVMWRSALSVRQAMYQAAVLSENAAAEALERALLQEPAYHILAVNGLPALGGPGQGRQGMGGPPAGSDGGPMRTREGQPQMSPEQRVEMRKQMEGRQLAATKLIIDGEEASAVRMEMVPAGEGRIALFYFPRNRDLGATVKEAKFETQMGPLKISAKFKPKEMVLAVKSRS